MQELEFCLQSVLLLLQLLTHLAADDSVLFTSYLTLIWIFLSRVDNWMTIKTRCFIAQHHK